MWESLDFGGQLCDLCRFLGTQGGARLAITSPGEDRLVPREQAELLEVPPCRHMALILPLPANVPDEHDLALQGSMCRGRES